MKRFCILLVLFLSLHVEHSYGQERACDCKDLLKIRKVGPNLPTTLKKLYELDYIPDHKLAYTLDEFVALPPSPNSVNCECIGGNYSRFVIGKKTNWLKQTQRIMLISAPYYGKEAHEDDVKKDLYFSELLEAMCYTQVDQGWISNAEWHKLSGDNQTPSLRITNGNFSDLGRLTTGGEHLIAGSEADLFIQEYKIKVANSLTLNLMHKTVDRFHGHNFPTEGYVSWDQRPFAGENSVLKPMYLNWWNDRQVDYIYDINLRSNFKARFSENMITVNSKNNFYGIYVMDCMGDLYLRDEFSKHAPILGGAAIVSAGMMNILDGKITMINNASGHYEPTCDNLKIAIDYINEHYHMNLPPSQPLRSYICISMIPVNDRNGVDHIDQLAAFPNPVSSKLQLSFENPIALTDYAIEVKNTLGELVLQKKIYKGENLTNYTIEVEGLNDGMYLIYIPTLTSNVLKFVVIRK